MDRVPICGIVSIESTALRFVADLLRGGVIWDLETSESSLMTGLRLIPCTEDRTSTWPVDNARRGRVRLGRVPKT